MRPTDQKSAMSAALRRRTISAAMDSVILTLFAMAVVGGIAAIFVAMVYVPCNNEVHERRAELRESYKSPCQEPYCECDWCLKKCSCDLCVANEACR